MDNIWCNDREIIRTYTNGSYTLTNSHWQYVLNNTIHFAPRFRLDSSVVPYRNASLVCQNKNDSFSMVETAIANGALTYPVGLITADEVALAGGMRNQVNENYYLRTNGTYFTMTTDYYSSSNVIMYGVAVDGGLTTPYHFNDHGFRPVINLNKDVTIMRGDGTPTNPYVIE